MRAIGGEPNIPFQEYSTSERATRAIGGENFFWLAEVTHPW